MLEDLGSLVKVYMGGDCEFEIGPRIRGLSACYCSGLP